MHSTLAPPPAARPDRPRWVIAELDVRGEIDDHAAMCLRQAIEAHGGAAAMILVDLRELTAIDGGGLELFVRQHAGCRTRGIELGLLICGDARQNAIARAFDAAGLGDQLQFAYELPSPPRRRRVPALPATRVSAAWLRRLQRGSY
jgi:anti-anti-sigma factor